MRILELLMLLAAIPGIHSRPLKGKHMDLTETEESEVPLFVEEPCLARLYIERIELSDNPGRYTHKKWLECETSKGSYRLPMDQAWIEEKEAEGAFRSGDTFMDIPVGTEVDRASQMLNISGYPRFVQPEDLEEELTNTIQVRRRDCQLCF